jgi:hypothetical protein
MFDNGAVGFVHCKDENVEKTRKAIDAEERGAPTP